MYDGDGDDGGGLGCLCSIFIPHLMQYSFRGRLGPGVGGYSWV